MKKCRSERVRQPVSYSRASAAVIFEKKKKTCVRGRRRGSKRLAELSECLLCVTLIAAIDRVRTEWLRHDAGAEINPPRRCVTFPRRRQTGPRGRHDFVAQQLLSSGFSSANLSRQPSGPNVKLLQAAAQNHRRRRRRRK